MNLKSEVIKLIERGYEMERVFVETLPDSERDAAGSFSEWSPKDVLNHSAYWTMDAAANLERIRTGQKPQWIEDYNHQNELIYEEHREDDWDTVLQYVSEAMEKLVYEAGQLTEEQFFDEEYLQREQKRPAWQHILGAGYMHVVMHLADYWIRQNREALVRDAYSGMAEKVVPLDDDPSWQGTIIYNQACIEALIGEEQTALDLLAQAFEQRPDLKEWAQQDTDLTSLHDLPAFMELTD